MNTMNGKDIIAAPCDRDVLCFGANTDMYVLSTCGSSLLATQRVAALKCSMDIVLMTLGLGPLIMV